MNTIYRLSLLFILVMTMHCGYSQFSSPGFGKQKNKDSNPFRIFYFGYDIVHPGLSMGPVYDFLWAKHEKIVCDQGHKVIDKKLLFVPQFGFITEPTSAFSIFANIELDFQTTYNNSWIFEVFVSGGYALKFGDGQMPLGQMEIEDVFTTSRGAFMPQFGIGTGYDFNKWGDGVPICINFRVLTASTNVKQSAILPAFQAGLTYQLRK